MFDFSLDWWMKTQGFGTVEREPVEGARDRVSTTLIKYRKHRKIRNRIAKMSRRRNR